MFSALLAFALYAVVSHAQPEISVASLIPRQQFFLPVSAAAERPALPPSAPVKKDSMRVGIETQSKSAIAVDLRTGTPLYRKNSDEPLPIASITKLMTALVVIDRGMPMDSVVEMSGKDSRPGNIPYIVPGERVRVTDLMHAMLITSSNDAAAALGRATGLTEEEFAAAMNDLAKRIGMRSATFVEPTGLDSGNRASAADVAVLIRQALQDTTVSEIVTKDEYSFTALTGAFHSLPSTDDLLGSQISKPPYVFLGGKTGYLVEAGYCFGAGVRDADGNGVVAVVLDAPTKQARFDEVSALMYWTFDAYTWK